MDKLLYYWKRNNWVISANYLFYDCERKKMDHPVFLIGNQGDGLTLVSRMLRRHPQVVSVTGNSKYWAGADEMQNVFEPVLPPELSGIRLRAPKHKFLTPPRSWSYACDDLIDKYRKTDKDANDYLEKRLKQIIGYVISRYGRNIDTPRFVDKSQVFTVKMSLINKLLEDCSPYFIHVTRNPYATCYRAAIGKAGDMRRYAKYLSLDERIKICIQHWYNSAICVEEDKDKVANFMRIKFEDLLCDPENVLKKICDFVGLEFSDDMIPQPHHKLPLGVKYRDRWYPLRPDINRQYLEKIPEKYVDWIYQKCGKLARTYGYEPPEK